MKDAVASTKPASNGEVARLGLPPLAVEVITATLCCPRGVEGTTKRSLS
jgi:hypothetical protein